MVDTCCLMSCWTIYDFRSFQKSENRKYHKNLKTSLTYSLASSLTPKIKMLSIFVNRNLTFPAVLYFIRNLGFASIIFINFFFIFSFTYSDLGFLTLNAPQLTCLLSQTFYGTNIKYKLLRQGLYLSHNFKLQKEIIYAMNGSYFSFCWK